MPVIASLALALSPMFAGLARLIAGAGIALAMYVLIDETVRPYFEDIFLSIVGTAQEINSVAGAGASLFRYFEIVHLFQIVIAAYVAAFSIRVARLSFSAFTAAKI